MNKQRLQDSMLVDDTPLGEVESLSVSRSLGSVARKAFKFDENEPDSDWRNDFERKNGKTNNKHRKLAVAAEQPTVREVEEQEKLVPKKKIEIKVGGPENLRKSDSRSGKI
jgi:hypothetical protein